MAMAWRWPPDNCFDPGFQRGDADVQSIQPSSGPVAQWCGRSQERYQSAKHLAAQKQIAPHVDMVDRLRSWNTVFDIEGAAAVGGLTNRTPSRRPLWWAASGIGSPS